MVKKAIFSNLRKRISLFCVINAFFIHFSRFLNLPFRCEYSYSFIDMTI